MAIAGKGGKINIATNQIGDIASWSLDIGSDMLDTTVLGVNWKTFIQGLKEWSASCDGFWKVDSDTNGQTAMQTAYLNGTTIAVRLYVNSTNYYSGDAYVTSFSVEDAVDDTVNVTFELQGTGTLGYN